jgi:hypothetical protein
MVKSIGGKTRSVVVASILLSTRGDAGDHDRSSGAAKAGIPSIACSTSIDVWPASWSTIMLSWIGSRCWTRIKAAVSGWQRAYQRSAGIKAAGRSTDRADRELVRAMRRVT